MANHNDNGRQPAAAAAPKTGRVQIENLTRDVFIVPGDGNRLLVLGDREDTDAKVPKTGRDPRLQPNPKVTMSAAEWAAHGPFVHGIIKDQVAQGRVSLVELP